jgi:hypothetical protein
MIKYIVGLLSLLSVSAKYNSSQKLVSLLPGSFYSEPFNPKNNCITFSVSAGTGCAWMCNYCSNFLGTNNYYFTDGICKYETGGCIGDPIMGVSYTCCSN